MPKTRVSAPLGVPYTDERLGVPDDMIDDDHMGDVESRFFANESIEEGVSGRKKIDTLFENTSETDVESPRSGDQAAVQVNKYDYPHRRY